MVKARSYLLAAGHTSGAPTLDSFGPNMMLAKEMLEKGETASVLEYFGLCDKFWDRSCQNGALAEWTREVKAGIVPDFGANLIY
jgi:hypothetical protein